MYINFWFNKLMKIDLRSKRCFFWRLLVMFTIKTCELPLESSLKLYVAQRQLSLPTISNIPSSTFELLTARTCKTFFIRSKVRETVNPQDYLNPDKVLNPTLVEKFLYTPSHYTGCTTRLSTCARISETLEFNLTTIYFCLR